MEENEYLMWMKRKQVLKSHIEAPYFEANYNSSSSSWEERAFAEDAARILGGCIWPPRSYSCNFCKREFRSAQALGGHMNVHRRDRARLKQTLITPHPHPHHHHHNDNHDHDESSSSLNHHHHKNNNDFITTRKTSNQEDQKIMSHIWGQKMIESPDDDSEQKEGLVVNEESSRPNDDSVVETSLSVGLNSVFGQELPNDNKRPKTDSSVSSSNSLIHSVFIKPCSNFHHQSADFVLGMEDLDLELRLGKPQKA